MTTTREEFIDALAYNLTEEECQQLFNVSRDVLEDGSVAWNESLEYAYNIYIEEEEFLNSHED